MLSDAEAVLGEGAVRVGGVGVSRKESRSADVK
jgi:hypothetical protein